MEIIHNAINRSNFKELIDLVYSNQFNWYFVGDSIDGGTDCINYSFEHAVFKDDVITSNYHDFIRNIALQVKDKFKLDDYKIIRLRFGMITSYGKKIINKPHIDYDKKHKVILLYLDNSDGDTYFYKNKKIIKSISPEKNKAILFDGNIMHSSSKPLRNIRRIVLNINIEKINL